MIKVIFTILFTTATLSGFCQEKPLRNDTIVCIVDTSNFYTSYKENPFEKNPDSHWLVSIKGHYYDNKSPEDADCASIVFHTNFRNKPWVKGPLKIAIPINTLNERFTVITDEWLNQQRSFDTISLKTGIAPWHYYNYIIFKSNIATSADYKVVLHRVLVGYFEVSE